MAAPLDLAKLDNAIQLYLSGKPHREILSATGVSGSAFHRERTRRGIPPRRVIPLPSSEIATAYLAGESEYSLSRHYNVSRNVIRRHLQNEGVQLRGRSEAGKMRAAKMTPEERLAQASASHAAMRGRKRSYEEACRMALGRERTQAFHSVGEQALSEWLQQRGLSPISQKAIGKYNVDLAIKPVAVEVLGGGWHLEKRHHARRTPDILDAGWHLIFAWNYEGQSALTERAADYIVAFLQEIRREPPSIGQYRVITGGGKLLAARSRDDDDFTLVKPPRGRER